jgi:hypothetical protein
VQNATPIGQPRTLPQAPSASRLQSSSRRTLVDQDVSSTRRRTSTGILDEPDQMPNIVEEEVDRAESVPDTEEDENIGLSEANPILNEDITATASESSNQSKKRKRTSVNNMPRKRASLGTNANARTGPFLPSQSPADESIQSIDIDETSTSIKPALQASENRKKSDPKDKSKGSNMGKQSKKVSTAERNVPPIPVTAKGIYGLDSRPREPEREIPLAPPRKPRVTTKPLSTVQSGAITKPARNIAQVGKGRKKRKSSPQRREPGQENGKEPESRVSITVQRLNNTESLNFNDKKETEHTVPGFPQKQAPNAIDVLAQICREIISKNSETLKANMEKEGGKKRDEWKRKREAVRKFGEELDGRFHMMVCINSYQPFFFTNDLRLRPLTTTLH